MVYDDIIIGSGLTALATAVGLDPARRVLVLGGPQAGIVQYYDSARTVPRSYSGWGGLGNFWHGIIPLAASAPYAKEALPEIIALFRYFYPGSELQDKFGQPWLFVPRRPIRPSREWMRLAAERGGNLVIAHLRATRFRATDGGIEVDAPGETFSGRRLWIAAGVLDTPKLLEASTGKPLLRGHVSDHIIAYAGQIDRGRHRHIAPPAVHHVRDGYVASFSLDAAAQALFVMKPARFDYRVLDHGIEQRAAFGLPTGSAISKIMRARSLGLVAEALFNRLGLFPDARMLSVYAQVAVPDAYALHPSEGTLSADRATVMNAIGGVRAPWSELTRTRRPDLFINGIHLHHSVDLPALAQTGLCSQDSPISIVDASVLADIGPEHHSFYTMARAFKAARALRR